MNWDDNSFAFPIDGTITCRICGGEFNVLIWSAALRAGFCNPCFEAWYDKITKWLKNREGV
jgi:hypothetical protein